uniref:Uncharacterized protein n=1 Tax=Oryza barthii TaxID=65489 RepID=A0A0D3GT28_9ORYZ
MATEKDAITTPPTRERRQRRRRCHASQGISKAFASDFIHCHHRPTQQPLPNHPRIAQLLHQIALMSDMRSRGEAIKIIRTP